MYRFLTEIGEYSAAGLYEEEGRSLFYRKALGLRRFYETCELPQYTGKKLYPSGAAAMPFYLDNLVVDLKKISNLNCGAAEQIKKDFYHYRSAVPAEHTVAGNMYTHSMPHYERFLREGILSYIPRIEKIEDTDMREGLLHLVKGIECYIERCVAYLELEKADKVLIEALKKVPLYPAENIYEAIVAWNFVLYLDRCDNLGCVASGLYPYYKGEDITELLENLYDNLDINEGYSMALHTDYNPLTLQCLEASKGKRRPMIELFVDENTSREVWNKAFEVIRTTNGQPAFYNPKVLLEGLKKKFPVIKEGDIGRFCGGGCAESMIAGVSNVGSLDAGINLLLILEECIKTNLADAVSFDAFYRGYIVAVEQVVVNVTRGIYHSQKERALYNPLPMRTLLVDDCIEKGLDYNNGGARYMWSIINFAGIINVIDAMLVIRDLVFEEKWISAEELINKLTENDEEFLKQARNHHACFGKNEVDADSFAAQMVETIFAMLDGRKTYFGEGFLPASIQFQSQVEAGKKIGATPDGRECGAPLCDSLGAIFGKDTAGPTALLKSVAALKPGRILGTPILNFNINPDFKNEILQALIMGYMQMGGVQMQITCISREVLEEAYRDPESHKNLVVRVGGYSEYFYKLSDELKRMVINRTIQK